LEKLLFENVKLVATAGGTMVAPNPPIMFTPSTVIEDDDTTEISMLVN
jgi:hypothetical protein